MTRPIDQEPLWKRLLPFPDMRHDTMRILTHHAARNIAQHQGVEPPPDADIADPKKRLLLKGLAAGATAIAIPVFLGAKDVIPTLLTPDEGVLNKEFVDDPLALYRVPLGNAQTATNGFIENATPEVDVIINIATLSFLGKRNDTGLRIPDGLKTATIFAPYIQLEPISNELTARVRRHYVERYGSETFNTQNIIIPMVGKIASVISTLETQGAKDITPQNFDYDRLNLNIALDWAYALRFVITGVSNSALSKDVIKFITKHPPFMFSNISPALLEQGRKAKVAMGLQANARG